MKKLLTTLTVLSSFALVGQASAGDVDAGKRVWNKCRTCHTLEEGGRNKIGPNLFGIFGKEAGQNPEFRYSKAMAESGMVWSDENMAKYLKAPGRTIRGTKMAFAGLRKDKEIEDLLAYMKAEMGQ